MRAGFSALLRAASRHSAWRHPAVAFGAAAAAGVVGIGLTTEAHAHGTHAHTHDGKESGLAARLRQLEHQVADLSDRLRAHTADVQATTGQGKAVFSWDRGLTEAFPEDAKPFEKNLHGGFNEDPKTGIVVRDATARACICVYTPHLHERFACAWWWREWFT
jgi:hypothetical protein